MNLQAPLLVVDDSRTTRRMITRALVMGGVPGDRIVHAENGLEALEKIEALSPCLVVSDVNMPVMDGRELLIQLGERGLTGSLPVVMCTSVSSSRQLVELVRLGAQTVVRKPFNPHDLYRRIEPFLAPLPVDEVVDETPEPNTDDGDRFAELVARGIDEAFITLLGTAAFVEAARVDEEVPRDRIIFAAEIEFDGPISGSVAVGATMEAASEICTNLTGEAPERDDNARLDAVGEILNILAGELLGWLEAHEVEEASEVSFRPPDLTVKAPGLFDLPVATYAIDEGPLRLHLGWELRVSPRQTEAAA